MAAALRNTLSKSAPVIAAILVSACAGSLTPPQLALPSLPKVEVPEVKLPEVKMPKFELPKGIGPVVGTPTEVYTRVARGAMLCCVWIKWAR